MPTRATATAKARGDPRDTHRDGKRDSGDMSKLSPTLKAAINATFARPNTVPAPRGIRDVYRRIEADAARKDVGLMAWMTISAAATITLNSPASLLELHSLCITSQPDRAVQITESLREIALKCISFNGIPRTINVLSSFRAGLPPSLLSSLSAMPRRKSTPQTLSEIQDRGKGLWDSIYAPYEEKLLQRLADSHPDLPVIILNSNYGPLLADFPSSTDPDTESHDAERAKEKEKDNPAKIGRVLTSLVAISCLRAQTGVAPQVISHVFGLRKAFEDGSGPADEDVRGGAWLASDEGNLWVLKCVDSIVEEIGGREGGNFAPVKSKI